MEDRPFQVTKDLDGTKELVKVAGQARFGVSILAVRKQVYLWFFSLRLLRETSVYVKESIANEVADGRNHRKDY